jgi:hypothetical protein
MATVLHWTREEAPRWDADKQELFGPAELAATGLAPPAAGAPVADEWWHVTDAAGQVVPVSAVRGLTGRARSRRS